MPKKNHINLTKYYNRAATLPLCLSILLGIFLCAFHEQDPKYTSEYFTNDGFKYTVFLYILLSLALCLLSLTIFANTYKKISDQFLYSVATWLLLLFILLSYSFYKFL